MTNAVKEILKANKRVRATALHDYGSEEEQEKINPETLSVGEEWDNTSRKRKNEMEVRGKGTEARQWLNKISHLVKQNKKKK